MSIPLDNDVAGFSDTEGASRNRLPLYSENYESESFCLPSSGYKSDSEGRGRSKYKIRTSHSANPSPDNSPERPANRASVRRAKSLNVPTDSDRVLEIRQKLKESKRQEILKLSTNSKSNIHERLKQLGTRGLNTTNNAPKTNSEKTVYDTRNSLRSRSLNQIARTEKVHQPKEQHNSSQEINNNNNNSSNKTTGSKVSVLRSRSFNLLRNTETRNTQNSTEKVTNSNTSSTNKATKVDSTLQPSPTSAFEKVRQQFGNDKWKRNVPTNTQNDKNENLRSSSFSSLQDAWESRRTFDKTKKLFGNNHENNTNDTKTYTHIHQNSISDVESSDIISRRRERRRLKREIYNQRLQSDKSDSETETEDSHFARHALERLERRRANSNPKRSSSRSSKLIQQFNGNNSDSNDENNNECPSDKTLDSGVFDLALSNLSANISKLSKRYNSDEFLADCLSPKSGYSSATESLAESLAESTTTFYDSNEDHNDMDAKRKRSAVNRSRLKTDKTSAKTAVLNSTRAKGNLMNGANVKQGVNQPVKKDMLGMTDKKVKISQTIADTKQTTIPQTDLDQTKPQSKVNKKQSSFKSTPSDQKSQKPNKPVSETSKEQQPEDAQPQKDKQIIEKKSSLGKANERGDKNKENKPEGVKTSPKTASKEKTKTVDISSNKDTEVEKTQESSKKQEAKSKKDTQSPKKKNGVVDAIPKELETQIETAIESKQKEVIAEEEKVSEKTKPSSAKSPRNGLLGKERKISHHSCCVPNPEDRSNSPSLQQKKTRRVSHQGCHSPVDKINENSGSRSNTPTKTRRVSHIGCFPSTDKISDSESRSVTPTNRRISHHNCFKPVNTSESDNSRSNTPTRDVTPTNMRRISHHNCAESPSRIEEPFKKRRHSLQASPNSMERKLSNSNVNYRIHLQSNSPNKAAIIVGPAQIKDEIKPKFARECVSPTLHSSSSKQINHVTESDSSLCRIDENHIHDLNADGKADKKANAINEHKNGVLSCADNEITASLNKQRSNDEQHSAQSRSSDKEKQEHDMSKLQSVKFTIDSDKSRIQGKSGNTHTLIQQGEAIKLHLSLDKNILNSSNDKVSTQSDKTLPAVAPKPNQNKTKPQQQKHVESLHKAVQCLLLSEKSEQTLNVCDVGKEIKLSEGIVEELGSDILQGISFTCPEYLLTTEDRKNIEKDLKQLEAEEIESDLDEVDSANVGAQQHNRYKKEKEKSFKLKKENTRLQQLLYEVEKARAGTMKALLHVNNVLNKVQGENTQLEGDLEVADQENCSLKANIKEYQEKETACIDNTGGKKGDRSLSIFVDQWKKEKKELLGKLNSMKSQNEESEKANKRLQVQYKKMKEQLEHSNNAFTTTLQNNLEATKKMEEELKSSFDEKQDMLKRVSEGNKYKRELETLQAEMDELRAQNEEVKTVSLFFFNVLFRFKKDVAT